MKKCKITSLLIAISMIFSLIPIKVSFAELIGTDKGLVELVYMQKDPNATDGSFQYIESEKPDPANVQVGDRFYVGVRISNMENLVGASDGLFNFGAGIVFDPNYLTLEPDGTHKADGTMTDANLSKAISDRIVYNGSFTELGDGYSYDTTKDKPSDSDATTLTDTRTAVFNLTYGGGDNPPLVPTSNQEYYMAVVEFEMKAIPAAGETPRLLAISRSGGDFTIGFGVYGEKTYQYDLTGSDDVDLSVLLELKESSVNIYPKQVTVTYNKSTTDAQDANPATQTIEEETAVGTLPTPPKKPGKIFDKWVFEEKNDTNFEYSDGVDTVFDENTIVTEDTTVYATYKDGYAVTADANDGYFKNDGDTTDTSKKQVVLEKGLTDTVSAGEIPDTSTLARDKYHLDATNPWNSKANGTGDGYADAAAIAAAVNAKDPKESMDFYAQWIPDDEYDPTDPTNPDNAMKVVFDTRTADPANPAEVQLYSGEAIGGKMPDDPTKTGYKFDGWNTKANGTGTSVTKTTTITDTMSEVDAATRTLKLYAQWKADGADQVTVTFDKNDGTTEADPQTLTINKGDSILSGLGANAMPTEPTKSETESFVKWVTDLSNPDTTEFTENTPVNDSITVYAVYGTNVTVNIHSNMPFEAPATDDIIKTINMAAGRKVAADDIPTDPTRTGYTFAGWRAAASTDAADTANAADFDFTADNITTSTLEIYAIWSIDVEVEIEYPDGETSKEYTGDANPATVVVKDTSGNKLDTQPVAGTDYDVEYTDNDTGDTADTEGPTDKGTYTVDVVFNPGTTGIGVIYNYNPTDTPEYEISPKRIKISLDNQKVKVEEDSDNPGHNKQQGVTVGFGTPEPSPKPADTDYTVTYHKFTGTGTDIAASSELEKVQDASNNATQPTEVGKYAVEITFTNENYVFDGFADGTTVYTVSAADLTDRYFATFEIEKAEVTVMFYTDDGETVPTVYTYIVPSGTSISAGATENGNPVTTLPAEPTKANYKFVAWHIYKGTDADGDPKYDATRDDTDAFTADTVVEDNIKVVAEWKSSDDASMGKDDDGNMDVSFTAVEAADDGTETSTLPVENFFDSDYTTAKALDVEVTGDYYARVANKYNKIKISAAAAEPASTVEISVNGATAQTYVVTSEGLAGVGSAEDEVFDLAAATTDAPTNDIAIKITAPDGVATKTYTFKIQRLGLPKIELNYGNSPYGMIMKEAGWTDDQKTQAKEAFVTRNGRFDTTLVPTGGNATRYYRNQAWGGSMDSATNLDMDDHAIFVYNRTDFKDPGFKAYDSMGNAVDDTAITRTITVSRMQAAGTNGLSDANQADDTVTVTGKVNDYVFTEITAIPTAIKAIRPDVYEMKYSFTDTVSGDTAEIVRKVIVLGKLGDCDMSNIVNSSDMNAIKGSIGGSVLASNTNKASVKNLYIYRMVDTDRSGVVNASDMNAIKGAVGGTAIVPIYEPLPTN